MALPKNSTFSSSAAAVPAKAPELINNFASSLDQNILNIFKALTVDLDEFKQSLAGITRFGADDMLFVYNNPTGKEVGPQEAIRMDKNGNIAIGTEYPRWPRAKVDVNGALYAIPQYGRWHQTAVLAGNGLYTWDTESFNPNSDIYSRVAANTAIRVDEPGDYDIRTSLITRDLVAATSTRMVAALRRNATQQVNFFTALCTDDFAQVYTSVIVRLNRGDTIDAQLTGPATADRYGDANLGNTWLEICKVN